MPPLIATPTRESNAVCSTCGSTLIRTGKATIFTETRGLSPKVLPGKLIVKAASPWKGRLPSLLVTICPVCDSPAERPAASQAPEPVSKGKEIEAIRAAYIARKIEEQEHDE